MSNKEKCGCKWWAGPGLARAAREKIGFAGQGRFLTLRYAEYGIYLSETCKARQIMFNPLHEAAKMLPYNTPSDFDAYREKPLSRSARRRQHGGGKKKRRRVDGASTSGL